jgi:hypothetical protein
MRKMKFLSVVAAMLAVSAFVTSCKTNDDNPLPIPVNVKIAADKYQIYAFSNEAVNFTIDVPATTDKSADGMYASFTDIDLSNTTVKVTATLLDGDGFITKTQTAIVKFSDKNTAAAIAFDFAKLSTDSKSQEEIAASTNPIVVTSNLSDIYAELILAGGTTVADGTNDPFSITAYWGAPTIITADGVKTGESLGDVPVIVLSCTPTGNLSTAATIKVNVGIELAGETMTLGNQTTGEKVTGTVQDDGNVEFQVDKLGDWILVFAPVASKVDKGSVVLATIKDMPVTKGTNTFGFTKNVGVDFSSNGLIALFIKKMFGETAFKEDVTRSFEADRDGTINIGVSQNYFDYTYKFGSKSFGFRVWGNVFTSLSDIDHSGGGAQ